MIKGGKKPLLTLERGEVTEEGGRGSGPPWCPRGGMGLWQELGCFLSLTKEKRRGRGTKEAEYKCGPSMHTLSDAHLSPPFVPTPVTPGGTCLVSLLGQVALPRTGMGCAITSRFCKQPVDTSYHMFQPLCLPHQAVSLPGKLGRGPWDPHPLHQSPSPHPRAVASLSPLPKVTEHTTPFQMWLSPSLAQPVST